MSTVRWMETLIVWANIILETHILTISTRVVFTTNNPRPYGWGILILRLRRV
ncbi:hypothetical protein IPM62_01120 [Candidatus Woesebacteria bacterium]|nr:MAG: hypothetical protein IPM62_01120 [Candidatus Woesebacteria bacterium]